MNDKVTMPPRQKRLFTRKPDPHKSHSKSDTSRRKPQAMSQLATTHNFGDCSFISLKHDATPEKIQRSTSSRMLLQLNTSSNTRNIHLTHRRIITETPTAESQDASHTSYDKRSLSPRPQNSENVYDESSFDIKITTEMAKGRMEIEALSLENRKLRSELEALKKEKLTTSIHNRALDQLTQLKKQTQNLKYQCHFLNSTIASLEQKLSDVNKRYAQLKMSHDLLFQQADTFKYKFNVLESLNRCLEQSNKDLKSQMQRMSQQMRYLQITLSLKERRCLEMDKMEKENSSSKDLRRDNKRLKNKIIELKQKVLIDEIYELTPEKGE